MVVKRCVDAIGGRDPDAVSDEVLQVILDANSSSCALWTDFFKKLFLGGAKPDKKRRPNLIWDCQILSNSEGLEIDGHPIMLVTSDREMLNAAMAASKRENCMDVGEYGSLLS